MAATIKDIAHETGLSLGTISNYFNGRTVRRHNRKLIEDAVKKLDYTPNEIGRNLRTHQSHIIGVLIPELGNAFISSIIAVMEDILRRHNYAVIVCDCHSDPEREKEVIQFFLRKRVDGLINMPTDMTGAHLQPVIDSKIPVILLDQLIPDMNKQTSAIVIDNADAAKQATLHLLEHDHQRIGLILGKASLYTTQQRRLGYLKALEQHGIAPQEELIRYGDYTADGGYLTVKELLELPEKPTALFITNFEMTIGAMMALNKLGMRVPEDISIIGFDTLKLFGHVFFDLTRIEQPQEFIGEQAANLLLSYIETPTNPAQVMILNARLHLGHTVLPLQKADS